MGEGLLYAGLAIVGGLILLLWSADRFIEGAASTARHFRISPLMIGMVVVGFGTSAPELLVSALASIQGNPGIALGNAYGSNITNIALILGITALISPVAVQSGILKKELPLLSLVTVVAVIQLLDGQLSRLDAVALLLLFGALMAWTIREGTKEKADPFAREMEAELQERSMPLKRALVWLVLGLLLLLVSSRMLVWGAVAVAQALRISDLIIGLTVVAVGTSLPELASSVVSARKGEHDLALGNILGSNLFNTLAVVGIAGSIHPLKVEEVVLHRDMIVMAGLTFSLFLLGYGFRGPGRINRWEGLALILVYCGYLTYLVFSVTQTR
ncbi:MAG: calcium/sodium antiporter [Leptospiraceae bacterium]|nr:calcium/sodium antiporter [Leptospiraceae bacterium]